MARYGYRSSSYGGDPYWTTAKFNSVADDGTPVKKGQDILYYPRTKTVMVGERAKQAWRDFQSAKADESFMGGGYRNPRKQRNPVRTHAFLCYKSAHGRPTVVERRADILTAADAKREAANLCRLYGYKRAEWAGPSSKRNPQQHDFSEGTYPKSLYPWGVKYKRKLPVTGLVVDGELTSFRSEEDAHKWATSPRVAKAGYFNIRVYQRNPRTKGR